MFKKCDQHIITIVNLAKWQEGLIMSYIEAGSTVTVVSDSGVEAEALVVSSSAKKIRINMQGVPLNFLIDSKGNWIAKFSGLNFSILKNDN